VSTQKGLGAVLHLRLSTHEKELWVEAAGGPRRLSEWVRDRCNAGLGEGEVPGLVALPSEGLREVGSTPTSQTSSSPSPVCSKLPFHATQTAACTECGALPVVVVRERQFTPDFKLGRKS